MVHLLLVVIYISFIGLGLPDALLGSAWPTMHEELGIPVSHAGVISTIIAAGTVVSSLMSDGVLRNLGTGKVTTISAAITAAALLGFSASSSFWMLCLWAVPYGLGAGSVDAALNHYVALHYASRHMSWLHCMWGIGAALGPCVIGHFLAGGQGWSEGYRCMGILQILLTMVLFFSLPLWKRRQAGKNAERTEKVDEPLSMGQIINIPGAKEVMVTFFCYSALEQTTGLWASSYLALVKGVPSETAASFAGMFYIGITAGRALNGFLTFRLKDTQLVRLGQGMAGLGVLLMLLPGGETISLVGLVLIGLGCAPIYPCTIHSTPVRFGEEIAQALIGVQMASAYIGTCLMPPLFGLIADWINAALLPVYLLLVLTAMILMHERAVRKCGA